MVLFVFMQIVSSLDWHSRSVRCCTNMAQRDVCYDLCPTRTMLTVNLQCWYIKHVKQFKVEEGKAAVRSY